jgi:hypothetical protein
MSDELRKDASDAALTPWQNHDIRRTARSCWSSFRDLFRTLREEGPPKTAPAWGEARCRPSAAYSRAIPIALPKSLSSARLGGVPPTDIARSSRMVPKAFLSLAAEDAKFVERVYRHLPHGQAFFLSRVLPMDP